jgi:hypothetical protein
MWGKTWCTVEECSCANPLALTKDPKVHELAREVCSGWVAGKLHWHTIHL